jgi:DNA-binding NarL/FixJ family response regulator
MDITRPADHPPITVAVVEDDPGLLGALRAYLDEGPGTRCVAACSSGEAALEVLPGVRPQVVLMDINLPAMSGVECVERLAPLLAGTHIIMLTIYDNTDLVFRSLAAGAIGFLRKPMEPERLLAAIREAQAGGAPITSGIARRVIQSFHRPSAAPPPSAVEAALAPREAEILRLLADGLQNKEVAARLGISVATVQSHTARIYRKLQVRSRGQALARFFNDRPAPPR